MIPIVAKTGEGIKALFDKVVAVFEGHDDTVRHIHVNLGNDIEGAIRQLVDMIKASPAMNKQFSPRYLAIKLLEGDHRIEDEIPAGEKTAEDKSSACRPGKRGFWSRMFRRDCCGESSCGRHDWREHVRAGADSPIVLMRDKLRGHIESLHDEDI